MEQDYTRSEGAYSPPAPSQPSASFPNRTPQNMPGVGHDGCPVFPSTMKYMSATTSSLAAGASQTLTFTTPGAFCPMKMLMFASVDIGDVTVDSVKSGLEDQVIEGPIPATLWGLDNNCCPVACLRCLCAPGVPLEVTVTNDDAMAQTVTVTLVGAYRDACPPNGIMGMLPEIPGCPTPGSDKLLGFELEIPGSSSESVELTTPGRFCPRQLFLEATDITSITLTSIQSGLKDQIISGAIPGRLFSDENDCCILSCFDCLCAPGYPLTLTFANSDAASSTVTGVLVGSYVDACP